MKWLSLTLDVLFHLSPTVTRLGSRLPIRRSVLPVPAGASSYLAMLAIAGFLGATWTASKVSKLLG